MKAFHRQVSINGLLLELGEVDAVDEGFKL